MPKICRLIGSFVIFQYKAPLNQRRLITCLPLIASMDVIGPTVVLGEGLASPGFDLGPGLRGIGPEGMVGGQAQGHETEACEIERAIVGVPVGYLRLGATETDGQVTCVVEVLLEVKHTVVYLRQCSTYLSVGELGRQFLIPCYQG